MSFILDALKKSEAERQRQHAPGIANIPDPSARKSPHKWIWLVAVLLGINLAALMGVLYMANQSAEPSPGSGVVASSNTDQSATSFSDMVAEAKRTQPERNEVTAGSTTATNAAADAGSQTISAVNESYSTFADLRTQGTLSLPDLHLDIHVFSGEPDERFVFINMTKYKESGKLSEGPIVKQITPEGVILGFQGTDFLLPRE